LSGDQYIRPVSTAGSPSLANRKRELVREELAAAAAQLLHEREYDSITVDDITLAAGVSRRTFFRYFSSKEDVFLATFANFGREVQERLAERPSDEPPAKALRRAFAIDREQDDKVFELARTTRNVPALYARQLEQTALRRTVLAGELGSRSGIDPARDVRPTLAAAVALAAYDTAVTRWVASRHAKNLQTYLDEAFSLVGDSIDAMLAPSGGPSPR
jgi:AcrR family transcriptional regulator